MPLYKKHLISNKCGLVRYVGKSDVVKEWLAENSEEIDNLDHDALTDAVLKQLSLDNLPELSLDDLSEENSYRQHLKEAKNCIRRLYARTV